LSRRIKISWLLAGLLLSVHAGPAGAEVADAVSSEDEPGFADRPSGATALLASAFYPGLGQLLNENDAKAAVVGTAEAFLVARLVLEDRRTRNSLRMYKQTGDREYFDQYSDHFDRRQTLMWWAVMVALYAVADAYVDAHLGEFAGDAELSLGSGVDGPNEAADGLRLALSFSF
jgi:hypothetical protein